MSRQLGFVLLALVFVVPALVGFWLRWLTRHDEIFKKGGP